MGIRFRPVALAVPPLRFGFAGFGPDRLNNIRGCAASGRLQASELCLGPRSHSSVCGLVIHFAGSALGAHCESRIVERPERHDVVRTLAAAEFRQQQAPGGCVISTPTSSPQASPSSRFKTTGMGRRNKHLPIAITLDEVHRIDRQVRRQVRCSTQRRVRLREPRGATSQIEIEAMKARSIHIAASEMGQPDW